MYFLVSGFNGGGAWLTWRADRWGKDRVEQAEKTNREYQEGFSPDAKKKPSPVRSKLRDRMAYFESMQNNGKVQTETIEVEKELNV
jgi:hypothetical protein